MDLHEANDKLHTIIDSKSATEWEKRFSCSVVERYERLGWRGLSPKQEALINDIATKVSERAAHPTPVRVSAHQGALKAKICRDVTVTVAMWVPGFRGEQVMVIMRDSEGNAYKWMCTAGMNVSEHVHRKFRLTGTVKEHAEWKGVCQTVLTRCKLVPIETVSVRDVAAQ